MRKMIRARHPRQSDCEGRLSLGFQVDDIAFPIAAIKGDALPDRQGLVFDATQIDAPFVGMAARAVERFNPANRAE